MKFKFDDQGHIAWTAKELYQMVLENPLRLVNDYLMGAARPRHSPNTRNTATRPCRRGADGRSPQEPVSARELPHRLQHRSTGGKGLDRDVGRV